MWKEMRKRKKCKTKKNSGGIFPRALFTFRDWRGEKGRMRLETSDGKRKCEDAREIKEGNAKLESKEGERCV